VYMHWQRQFLHPMLRAFDAPTREQCTAQRPISNTPLAALTMLNDPTFVEAARGFAERIMREGGSEDEQKLHWAWCEAFSRQPEPSELEIARQLLHAGRQRYKTEPDAVQLLLSVGLMPRDPALAPAELAGWTSVARMLLNTNELITRN